MRQLVTVHPIDAHDFAPILNAVVDMPAMAEDADYFAVRMVARGNEMCSIPAHFKPAMALQPPLTELRTAQNVVRADGRVRDILNTPRHARGFEKRPGGRDKVWVLPTMNDARDRVRLAGGRRPDEIEAAQNEFGIEGVTAHKNVAAIPRLQCDIHARDVEPRALQTLRRPAGAAKQIEGSQ